MITEYNAAIFTAKVLFVVWQGQPVIQNVSDQAQPVPFHYVTKPNAAFTLLKTIPVLILIVLNDSTLVNFFIHWVVYAHIFHLTGY